MIKIRKYNTPDSWWYVSLNWNRKYGWLNLHIFGKAVTLFYGKNTKYIE